MDGGAQLGEGHHGRRRVGSVRARQRHPQAEQLQLLVGQRQGGEDRRAVEAGGQRTRPGQRRVGGGPAHLARQQRLRPVGVRGGAAVVGLVTEDVRGQRVVADRRDVVGLRGEPVGDLLGVPAPALAFGVQVQVHGGHHRDPEAVEHRPALREAAHHQLVERLFRVGEVAAQRPLPDLEAGAGRGRDEVLPDDLVVAAGLDQVVVPEGGGEAQVRAGRLERQRRAGGDLEYGVRDEAAGDHRGRVGEAGFAEVRCGGAVLGLRIRGRVDALAVGARGGRGSGGSGGFGIFGDRLARRGDLGDLGGLGHSPDPTTRRSAAVSHPPAPRRAAPSR